MIGPLLIPFAVALVAGFGATVIQRWLPPRVATWFLTLLAGATALAALWAVGLVAFGFLAQRPLIGHLFGWCHHLYRRHDGVALPLGAPALAMLVFMVARIGRVRRRHAHLLALVGPDPVEILPFAAPIAYAVPGRPGQIVVSTGMLRSLDSAERGVLFAHEEAHLRHRHYRFLSVAELAAAAVPLLQPLLTQLQYATERWADEDAARTVGDRHLVARAITRAALAATDHAAAPVMALTGSGVRARVEALRRDPPRWHAPTGLAFGAVLAGLVVCLAGSTMQLHHLVEFAFHICT